VARRKVDSRKDEIEVGFENSDLLFVGSDMALLAQTPLKSFDHVLKAPPFPWLPGCRENFVFREATSEIRQTSGSITDDQSEGFQIVRPCFLEVQIIESV